MFPEFGGQQGPGKKNKKIIINELVGSEVGRIRPTSEQPATEKKKRCKLVGSWSHPTNFRPTGVQKKRCELVGSWSRATNSRPTRSHGKKQSHKTLIVFLFCGEERLFHPYFIVTNASRCLIFFENACDITIFSVFFCSASWSEVGRMRPTSDQLALLFFSGVGWSEVGRTRPTSDQLASPGTEVGAGCSEVGRTRPIYTISRRFFFNFGWPEVSPIRPTSDHPVGRKLVSTH